MIPLYKAKLADIAPLLLIGSLEKTAIVVAARRPGGRREPAHSTKHGSPCACRLSYRQCRQRRGVLRAVTVVDIADGGRQAVRDAGAAGLPGLGQTDLPTLLCTIDSGFLDGGDLWMFCHGLRDGAGSGIGCWVPWENAGHGNGSLNGPVPALGVTAHSASVGALRPYTFPVLARSKGSPPARSSLTRRDMVGPPNTSKTSARL